MTPYIDYFKRDRMQKQIIHKVTTCMNEKST